MFLLLLIINSKESILFKYSLSFIIRVSLGNKYPTINPIMNIINP